jgi:hypothetical protein
MALCGRLGELGKMKRGMRRDAVLDAVEAVVGSRSGQWI